MTDRVRSDRPEPPAVHHGDRSFLRWNGHHQGATIFVVGAGPQLGELDDETLERLEREVTIGVNSTTYVFTPTYYMSAYPSQILLGQTSANGTPQFIQIRRTYEELVPGSVVIQRKRFWFWRRLHPTFTPPKPVLYTSRNVVLAATHFALVLGAQRIAYIGVEQRNKLHFWHTSPYVVPRMLDDIASLRGSPELGEDHRYESVDGLLDYVQTSASVAAEEDFYKKSHVRSFRRYLRELDRHGVEGVTTRDRTVVSAAGAEVVPLDRLLQWPKS